MQLVALLSSALAFFDAAPAPANPKLNAVVLVHGANFVQVDILRRHAVNLSFCRGDGHERRVGELPHALGCARGRDECTDLRDMASMRLWRNREIHFPAHELSTQDFANLVGLANGSKETNRIVTLRRGSGRCLPEVGQQADVRCT